ncbi:MAG: arsenic resistance N-acetyltransferase ArsN2 [Vicinamibacterales bacterium]
MTNIVIEPASPRERDAVLDLLADQRLPTAGLSEHWETTLVARSGERVVGSAALELYGPGALLRSVAVAGDSRGHGLGRALTHAALELAARRGVSELFLLTTTAEDFFPKFGFQPIARAEVPEAVRQSIEFTAACPSSATVMRKRL